MPKLNGPLIIISASGMATGGRVLRHLKQRLPDPNDTVLLWDTKQKAREAERCKTVQKRSRC